MSARGFRWQYDPPTESHYARWFYWGDAGLLAVVHEARGGDRRYGVRAVGNSPWGHIPIQYPVYFDSLLEAQANVVKYVKPGRVFD